MLKISAGGKKSLGADPAGFYKIWENSVKFVKSWPKSSFRAQCTVKN
jgi:hypothetical protein